MLASVGLVACGEGRSPSKFAKSVMLANFGLVAWRYQASVRDTDRVSLRIVISGEE